MKRVFQLIALATIGLSVVACSGGSEESSTPQVVKMGVDDASKMKKKDAPKADAPKADAPKADAPKADAPKADAPKADAPKADAPKADAPK